MQEKDKIFDITVTISDDELEAYITVSDKKDAKMPSVEFLIQKIQESGVVYGVDEDAVKHIVKNNICGKPVKIASALKPVDGKDGWFEFFFEMKTDNKPKILKDGSVDYSEYGDLPTVEEGQELVKYHRATEFKDGINVRGAVISAKKGKEQSKIKGKGFTFSPDDPDMYIAKCEGKVSYINDRLCVEQELVIEGDVSFTTGNIDFQNDVHVRGNVLSGVTVISQRGSIIVDGYVEQAHLTAKKGVILKNGMQGNGKGTIDAGGDVEGKFFEQVHVKCNGDVHANAIMNSYIDSGQDIIVSGKYGIIIGGDVHAVREIRTNIIGNMSEVHTNIKTGVDEDILALLSKCEHDMEECGNEIRKCSQVLAKMQEVLNKSPNPELQQKKMLVMRKKIECESQVSELDKKRQEIISMREKARDAKVSINKVVYPGTTITINGMKTYVTEENTHVEYARRGSGIIVYKIGE